MTQSEWQNEIKSSFEKLAAKSSAAQSKLLRDSVEFLKQTGQKKVDISTLSKTGTELLSEAVVEYTKLHLEYASKIIDLGLSFSNGMLSSLDKTAATESPQNTGSNTQAATAPSVLALQLSGKPGDVCQTAFILENTNKRPVIISFRYTKFHKEDKTLSISVPLRFEPVETVLNPEKKDRIILEAPIPNDAQEGQYSATVWLADVPEMNFNIALQVLASEGQLKKSDAAKTQNATVAKKNTGSRKKKKI